MTVEQINNTTGTVEYMHHDQQGSTRLLTGSTGATEGAYTFDAYGNQTGHTGTATTPLGYDGQYTNGDTGLIYLRARTYDPATAQFISVDPLEAVTGEPYGYAEQDPLNYKDRHGLGLEEVFEGGGGIPCLWCSWEKAAEEVLRPGVEAVEHGVHWVVNELGAEELGEPLVQSCAPSPALDGSPYSPGEVDRRRSALRRGLRTGNLDPESAIPDQPPGESLGRSAEPGAPHSTGERNVNPEEEHSRTLKGAPYYGP